MLPGKRYELKEFVSLTWQGRWIILLPLVSISLATYIVVSRSANVYQTKTLIYALGAALGLALGLSLVGAKEYLNVTMANEQEVVRAIAVPVVAVIPTMLTATDRLRRKRRNLAVAGVVAGGALAVAVALVWKLGL